jgi:hypothetical protein
MAYSMLSVSMSNPAHSFQHMHTAHSWLRRGWIAPSTHAKHKPVWVRGLEKGSPFTYSSMDLNWYLITKRFNDFGRAFHFLTAHRMCQTTWVHPNHPDINTCSVKVP